MDTSTYITAAIVYIACVGMVTSNISDDPENDMTTKEKIFWILFAPLSAFLIIRHEIKYDTEVP